jgi:hypothetical protein
MKKVIAIALMVTVLSLGFGVAAVSAEDSAVTVTTSLSGPSSVTVGEEATWEITIEVSASEDVTDVVVKDGMGADLDEIVVGTPSQGTADAAKKGKGKMGATMVTWEVGDLAAGESATLVVTVTTGENPTGKQEFTTAELGHELDGGASASYWYEGMEYESPETEPLTVDVVEVIE